MADSLHFRLVGQCFLLKPRKLRALDFRLFESEDSTLKLLQRLEGPCLCDEVVRVRRALLKLRCPGTRSLGYFVDLVDVKGDFFAQFVDLGLESIQPLLLEPHRGFQIFAHPGLHLFDLNLELLV